MSTRTLIRWGAGLALSGVAVVGTGAGAFAHECINSSRSDKGNTASGSHSQAWFTLHVTDAIAGDVESGLITAEEGECVLEAYEDTGAPMSFTIHVKGANGNDGTLAANNPNEGLMANGKGIDTLFAAHGEAIIGSYAACGIEF
jgi:hypothetical protein